MPKLELREFVKAAHQNAREKGFWDNYDRLRKFEDMLIRAAECWEHLHPKYNEAEEMLRMWHQINVEYRRFHMTTQLMLIVTELAEAVEALRNNDLAAFCEEVADTWIRLADFSGGRVSDITEQIKRKMDYNRGREKLHGKMF